MRSIRQRSFLAAFYRSLLPISISISPFLTTFRRLRSKGLSSRSLLIRFAVSTMPPPRLCRAGSSAPGTYFARYASKLSLHEIASITGVNASHLARTFRKHVHCSIGEYLRGLRVEAAVAMIMQVDMPLADIATMVGFGDQSHFIM